MYEKWIGQLNPDITVFYDEVTSSIFKEGQDREAQDIVLIPDEESNARREEITNYIQSIYDTIPPEYRPLNNSALSKGLYSIGVKKDVNDTIDQLCLFFNDITDPERIFICAILVQYEGKEISIMELKKMQFIKSKKGIIAKCDGLLIDLDCLTTSEYNFLMKFSGDFKSSFGSWLN